ncbi:hypothetical protein B0T26DRAFT_688348 [Lasiosphaeria miniovina]|uniref:Sm domain-containing protein n=1 Tax=Lasiosphaeria miniovina TaxID=1954250 RepID=A0AA40EAH5_9PEZI|nr:uncharacterized protein B0T26DRAFT_688348 [Lasiosphaeria miniovina]KAK0734404.1 hypothetical protein B0T26DRAFT_688348 [Lasiosphaeria miniovina]
MMRDDTSIDISTSLEAGDEQAKTREEAGGFLRSLLNKNLRVTTTDSRMFMGSFKCTDTESNIVLQDTYEYRQPSLQALQKQVEEAVGAAAAATIKADMTSRFLGLVVVPGNHIVKMELDEFVSQMRK